MNTNATLLWRTVTQSLLTLYPKDEAQSIAFYLLEGKYGCTRTDVVLEKPLKVDKAVLDALIQRLLNSEPVQYVVGKAYFYDMELLISPQTLIPRPETEELVHWIANDWQSPQTIVDIGTGSGCIALALKQQFPQANVHAIDISEEALSIAQQNAIQQQLQVHFHHLDILKDNLPVKNIDVLVSNPPYVLEKEQVLMRENVLAYEPKRALFVPNNQPLLFYERIAALGLTNLSKKGNLYFEINEAFGEQTIQMLQKLGYAQALLRQDMQGVDRMVRGIVGG